VKRTDQAQVTAAVAQTREHFGGLDVVVDNAGYGYLSAVEEIADDDAHAMFDVQIFGVLNVLRAALPVFRSNRRGHIVNVSSILGLTTFPGWGLYSAGKFALEALTEALAAEVADLGIGVNLVETTEAHRAMHGTQLGDPVKVAAAIIAVATSGTAPLHQFLGSDSVSFAEMRVKALQAPEWDVTGAAPILFLTYSRKGAYLVSCNKDTSITSTPRSNCAPWVYG
jgi:NAD(P)-dependent dehydrogenase (short-subunit alcohol dehydrogenase family)